MSDGDNCRQDKSPAYLRVYFYRCVSFMPNVSVCLCMQICGFVFVCVCVIVFGSVCVIISIPDICHEPHEHVRVNFFWPV